MCGADFQKSTPTFSRLGSPPRVRSRQSKRGYPQHGVGITSACAEQTRYEQGPERSRGDHLRVCGADTPVVSILAAGVGSPPRVRSRHGCLTNSFSITGITSACAEQTVGLGD